MGKPDYIELDDGRSIERIAILYEDRSVIAIDKPAGWLLVPFSWQKTRRNLHAALTSSIAAGEFWARSRNLRFLRHVHRLDGDTSGILLLATSMGAVNTYGDLFESRAMEKTYLVAVQGTPRATRWACRQKIGPVQREFGKMRVDERSGKEAETEFRVLDSRHGTSLLEARPYTGRTHQIRVHLLASGHPVVGDDLYGSAQPKASGRHRQEFPMALRATGLTYTNPFTRKPVRIQAPTNRFCAAFGFPDVAPQKTPRPEAP